MSLVSYAESDEGSDSDSCETTEPSTYNSATKEPQKTNISNKKDETLVVKDVSGKKDDNFKPKSIGGFFSSLPAPWMTSSSWANKTGSKKQTVKIALPVLSNDSDSDEETNPTVEKQKITSSQKSSSLFSLLPKPKNCVTVKENNPNRPVAKITNRPLIPDSLRRKQIQKKQSSNAKKTEENDSDDDNDDENISFFSLESKPTELNTQTNDHVGAKHLSVPFEGDSSSPGVPYDVTKKTSVTVGALYDGTLNPSGSTTSPSEQIEAPHMIAYQDNASQLSISEAKQSIEYAANDVGASQEYYQGYYPTNVTSDTLPHDGYQWQQQLAPQPSIPQELKKLQGKRRRGEEENIDIIDVNADDQIGPANDWKTRYNLDESGYQSQAKGHLPSTQQRRKHQITYLAFQAKESEWELRNQWARSSQTRRQTQAKYGF